jgi:hypothetical protein
MGEIIVGVLAFIGTLIGSVTSNRMTLYRIGQLEIKVDKHNHLVERMALVEQAIRHLQERIDKNEAEQV